MAKGGAAVVGGATRKRPIADFSAGVGRQSEAEVGIGDLAAEAAILLGGCGGVEAGADGTAEGDRSSASRTEPLLDTSQMEDRVAARMTNPNPTTTSGNRRHTNCALVGTSHQLTTLALTQGQELRLAILIRDSGDRTIGGRSGG